MATNRTHTDDLFGAELITPTVAEKYLAKNTHNRTIRQHRVDAYADDMTAGNWQWNGEAIKFAENGTLLDGQHRLLAIVQSGVPVKMMVVRGLPNSTQHTMDTGAKRTFSDVLKLRGEESYTILAATVRGVYWWEKGIRRFGGSSSTAATNTQLLETLDKHPWLREGMSLLGRVSAHAGLPVSASGALWFAFMSIDTEDANYFFERLASDENHSNGEPIYMLRRLLATSREDVRGARNVTYLAAVTVKAWNAYRAGEEVGQLRWRPGGANPEKFPEPK